MTLKILDVKYLRNRCVEEMKKIIDGKTIISNMTDNTGRGLKRFPTLKELDDTLWAKTIFGIIESQYLSSFPPLPPPDLQRNWCGNSGSALADQSLEFYKLIKKVFGQYGNKPLSEAKILDFGCGWGRLARLFMKDLSANQLFGCDPDTEIIKWCEKIPGNFRISDFRPKQLPFDDVFDMVYAFSIFTHLGHSTHKIVLDAIQRSLVPGGLLIATIRPRRFIDVRGGELAKLPVSDINRMLQMFDSGEFVFYPYKLPEVDGEVTYGEAIIPISFIGQEWTKFFKIVGIEKYCSDSMQIPIVLCKI